MSARAAAATQSELAKLLPLLGELDALLRRHHVQLTALTWLPGVHDRIEYLAEIKRIGPMGDGGSCVERQSARGPTMLAALVAALETTDRRSWFVEPTTGIAPLPAIRIPL